jgi:hypothetical protein
MAISSAVMGEVNDTILLVLMALILSWAVAAVQRLASTLPPLDEQLPIPSSSVPAVDVSAADARPAVKSSAVDGSAADARPAVKSSPVERSASAADARLLELRALVDGQLLIDPEDPDPQSSEHSLCRFLRAVGGEDTKHAAHRLVNTARWRFENKPWAWTCTFCEALPGHHTWRQFGTDKRGRPCVYSCLAQAATHRYTAKCAVEHCVYAIEQAVRTMPDGEVGWIWVCDFSGFTLRAVDLSMAAGVIRVVGEHYPERLALFMCVNTPRLFMPVWRAISAIVDPTTTRKARLVSDHDETRRALHEVMPSEEAEWVMTELTTNLLRPLPFAQSCAGFWKPPIPGAAHDPRGTAKYVATHLARWKQAAGAGRQVALHRPHPNIALELAGRYAPLNSEGVPAAAALPQGTVGAKHAPPVAGKAPRGHGHARVASSM